MAKNIRRMLAMVLVMCMFVSALPMQALAAEGDSVVTEGPVVGTTEEGLTTSTTTTTTTSTVDEVQTVVVETVTQTSGTTDSGVTVTGSETVTDTTTTQNDGTTQTSTVGSSEETRQSENLGADVPAVEVPVIPNDTVFESDDATKDVDVQGGVEEEKLGSGTYNGGKPFDVYDQHSTKETTTTENVTINNQEKVEEGNKTVETSTSTTINQTTVESFEEDAIEYRDRGSNEVILREDVFQTNDTVVTTKTDVKVTQTTTVLTGDLKENDDDRVYDYTETKTTVERDVSTKAEVTVEDESTFNMNQAVTPEDYEGKKYTSDGVKVSGASAMKFDGLQDTFDPDKENPGPKPSEEDDPSYKGYDYVLSGQGDTTWAAAPVFMNVVYVKNEDGTPKQDENGNYIIDEEKSHLVYAGDKAGNSGMDGTPGQIVLRNEEGEHFYTYCIDKGTPTASDSWYKITNLEDSDYYPDDESAAMLRAIVTNGYWGTDANVYVTDDNGNKITKKDADGNIVVDETVQGSLASIKALMRDTYGENDTVTVKDKAGNDHTYKIADLIDGLKEHEALAVTQAAIWSYSNGSLAAQNGQDGVICIGVQSAQKYYNGIDKAEPSPLNQYAPTYDLESDARLKALYDLYMNMEPMESDPEKVTTVINEQNSFKDMSFVVNEKVAEKGDKDVYNVDVQFSLDFELDDSHDLKIRLTDANGANIVDAEGNEIVIEKKLSLNNPNEDKDTLVADKNGVYTLTGLKLSEGTDFSFKLTLEGTQELEEGVYVYTSHGGQAHSQTLVGLASGTQNVNTSATMNVNFNVKEAQTVTIKHEWSTDPKESFTPPTPPTPPEDPVTPPTPPAPPAEPAVVDYYEPPAPVARAARAVWTAPENQRLANEEAVEIPEEPVPLATPAITGDDTGLWVMALMMIACCMVAINVFDKKRSHEAF